MSDLTKGAAKESVWCNIFSGDIDLFYGVFFFICRFTTITIAREHHPFAHQSNKTKTKSIYLEQTKRSSDEHFSFHWFRSQRIQSILYIYIRIYVCSQSLSLSLSLSLAAKQNWFQFYLYRKRPITYSSSVGNNNICVAFCLCVVIYHSSIFSIWIVTKQMTQWKTTSETTCLLQKYSKQVLTHRLLCLWLCISVQFVFFSSFCCCWCV